MGNQYTLRARGYNALKAKAKAKARTSPTVPTSATSSPTVPAGNPKPDALPVAPGGNQLLTEAVALPPVIVQDEGSDPTFVPAGE